MHSSAPIQVAIFMMIPPDFVCQQTSVQTKFKTSKQLRSFLENLQVCIKHKKRFKKVLRHGDTKFTLQWRKGGRKKSIFKYYYRVVKPLKYSLNRYNVPQFFGQLISLSCCSEIQFECNFLFPLYTIVYKTNELTIYKLTIYK